MSKNLGNFNTTGYVTGQPADHLRSNEQLNLPLHYDASNYTRQKPRYNIAVGTTAPQDKASTTQMHSPQIVTQKTVTTSDRTQSFLENTPYQDNRKPVSWNNIYGDVLDI